MKIILFVIVISSILGLVFLGLLLHIILRKKNKSISFHRKGNKNLSENSTTTPPQQDIKEK
jgi:hypothetical protein